MPTDPPDRRPCPLRALTRRVRGAADRVARRTPAGRERSVDGIRAVAVGAVALGHWLVTAPVLRGEGVLQASSPLRAMPELAPMSWLLQALALFFLVGGYVAALSLGRARARGDRYRMWISGRIARLGRPVVGVTALWGAALIVLALAGVPGATLRTALVLVLQPLWFLGVFALVTALTPAALAVERRLGVWAAPAAVGVVAAVDLAYLVGPLPAWAGLAHVVPVWGAAFLLGISWQRGSLPRPMAGVFLVAGVALLVLLTTRLGYPVAAVGVPGAARSNTDPPSLVLAVLALAQAGAAVCAAPALERLLRRPVLWAAVAWVNLNALTVFCWHLSALSVPALAAASLLPNTAVPGLTSAPEGPAWVGARLAWLPVFAVLTVAACAALNRFERPWTGVLARPGVRTAAAVGVAAFGAATLVLY